MQEEQQKKVLGAFRVVLRPIIKILLRYGIGFSQFAETVKTAYVDVASSEFGIRGRPTNISRVAVMTGLTRKEVRRLRNIIESGEAPISPKTTPIVEILHRWHAEKDFIDHQGRPLALEFAGGQSSFSALVKKFGGDVPAGAMRTELKRVGAISEDENGNLVVRKRSYWPADSTDIVVDALIHHLYPLASNVAHNSEPQNSDDILAEYSAHSTDIPTSARPQLRRICSDRIRAFMESMDDVFIPLEGGADSEIQSDPKRPVVVGVYYFEERDENASYDW